MAHMDVLVSGILLHHRYKIKEILGRGGTGIVYSAYDMVQNMEVAVKELFPYGCCVRDFDQKSICPSSHNANLQYQHFRENFIREAKLMSDFSKCPYIPALYDLFEENNTWYYAMELLKGITLRQYLRFCGYPLLEKDVFQIATKVLIILSYMHQKNIIHRDICTDNIFLTESGGALLIDLGSAISYTDTKSILLMIRKGYAPPEQYRADGFLGPWTDIYALGAVMYEALTQKKVPESVERQLEDKIIPPKLINRNITENMNSAILKALSLNEKKRFQTQEEFHEYLRTGNNAMGRIMKYVCMLIWFVLLVCGCIFILFVSWN